MLLGACVILLSNATNARLADYFWRIHDQTSVSKAKIAALIIAGRIEQYEGNPLKADSTFTIAQQEAAESSSDTLLYYVYSHYLKVSYNSENRLRNDFILGLIQTGLQEGNVNWQYEGYIALANYALNNDDDSTGQPAVALAENIANTHEGLAKSELWLVKGMFAEHQRNYLEAFRCYLSALYLAEEENDDEQQMHCYESLASFQATVNDFEKATVYKLKEVSLYHMLHPSDTVEYLDRKTVLATYYFYQKMPVVAEAMLRQIVDWSRSRNVQRLTLNALEQWRSWLINVGDVAAVEELYLKTYPGELGYLEHNNPLLYYRLKAAFSELNGRNDLARSYYHFADTILQTIEVDNTYRANFYRRYGQFLIRAGDFMFAEQILLRAAEINSARIYLPYAIHLAQLLDTVYWHSGNYQKAYEYSRLQAVYYQQQAEAARQDKLLRIELEHEARSRALQHERLEAETKRRHNLQYTGITLVIIGLFTALLLSGSIQPKKWVIHALGFISFILFFEFIILLLDHQIMTLTHEEPWKMLGIKIILISFLLPFHHWLEHKVVHYLSSHKLIDPSKLWLSKRRPPVAAMREGDAAPNEGH